MLLKEQMLERKKKAVSFTTIGFLNYDNQFIYCLLV